MNGTEEAALAARKKGRRSTSGAHAMKAKLLDDQGAHFWLPSVLNGMNGAAPACNGASSNGQHSTPSRAGRLQPPSPPPSARSATDPANHWAHVWDVGARAAAAAAAAHKKSKLGQWARLRREARGGSVLPASEIKALGEQYNCLEHEFEGFKQLWPALDALGARRRALRRARSTGDGVRAAAGERALTRAVSAVQGGSGRQAAEPPSPTAPSPTALPTALTEKRAQLAEPDTQEATRPRLVSFQQGTGAPSSRRGSSSGSGAAAATRARTPERAPSAAAASRPSGSRPRASSSGAAAAAARAAAALRSPERVRPQPAQQQRAPSKPRGQLTPPRVASAGTAAAARARTPQKPQQGSSARRESVRGDGEGRSGTAAAASATPAHAAPTATPTSHFTVHSHSSSSPPTTFEWQFAGGTTPVATPFSAQQQQQGGAHTPRAATPYAQHAPQQQQLVDGLEDDDDEDPFSMPTFSLPRSCSKGAAAAAVAALHQPRSHFSGTPTAGMRGGARASSELLLPSLGSVNLMLAATSNPSSPRPPSAKGLSPGSVQAKQQQQAQQLQQLQQEAVQQQHVNSLCHSADSPQEREQAHQQHVRLMQRRLIHEQRRLALLQARTAEDGDSGASAGYANGAAGAAMADGGVGNGSPVGMLGRRAASTAPHATVTAPVAALVSPGKGGAARMQHASTQGEGEFGGVALQGSTAQRSMTPPLPSQSARTTPGAEQRGHARVMAMAAALEASRHASPAAAQPLRAGSSSSSSSSRRKTEEGRGVHTLTPSRAASAGARTHVSPASTATRTPSTAKTPVARTTKPTVSCGSTTPSTAHRTTPHTATFSAAASAAAAASSTRNNKQPHSQPLPQQHHHANHHPLQTKTSLLHLAASPPQTSPHSRKNSTTATHTHDPASALAAAAASLSTSSSSQHGLAHTSRLSSNSTRRAHALNSSNSSNGSGSAPPHSLTTRRPSHPGTTTRTRVISPLPPRPSSSSRSVPRTPPPHTRTPPALTPTHHPLDARTPPSTHHAAASPFATPASRASSTSSRSTRAGSGAASAWTTPTLPSHAEALARDSGSSAHPTSGGRRSSSGVSAAYLQRLKSDVRARAREREAADAAAAAAAAAAPTPSALSPCATMRSARSIDASPLPFALHPHLAHTAPPQTSPTPRAGRHTTANHVHTHTSASPATTSSTSSEEVSLRSFGRPAHRHTSSGVHVRTPPSAASPYAELPDFSQGLSAREEGERSVLGGLGTSRPHSPSHGGRSEDMMPLKQLSAMRSGHQSRMSASSSTSCGTALVRTTHGSSQFVSPLRKSRASDSEPNAQQHQLRQQLHHQHHPTPHTQRHSVTFAGLPRSPPSATHKATSTPNNAAAAAASTRHPSAHKRSPSPTPAPATLPLPHAVHWASTHITATPTSSSGRPHPGSRRSSMRGPPTPPACTPLPFQALQQSKSFTSSRGGSGSGSALAAARAAVLAGQSPPVNGVGGAKSPSSPSQPQQQQQQQQQQGAGAQVVQRQPPRSHGLDLVKERPSFKTNTRAELDADADVELVCSDAEDEGSSQARTGGDAAQAAAEHHHQLPQQQQQQRQQQQQQQPQSWGAGVDEAKRALSSYWSRLFSRPSQRPTSHLNPQHSPLGVVGEMA